MPQDFGLAQSSGIQHATVVRLTCRIWLSTQNRKVSEVKETVIVKGEQLGCRVLPFVCKAVGAITGTCSFNNELVEICTLMIYCHRDWRTVDSPHRGGRKMRLTSCNFFANAEHQLFYIDFWIGCI